MQTIDLDHKRMRRTPPRWDEKNGLPNFLSLAHHTEV
jgi:hypothetical protein